MSEQNSKPYTKTYPISWEQLHRDSKALAWRLLDNNYFKGLIAVTRDFRKGTRHPAGRYGVHLKLRLEGSYR